MRQYLGVCFIVLSGLLIGGCPMMGNDMPPNMDDDTPLELTEEQQQAVDAALVAFQGLLDTNEAAIASTAENNTAPRSKLTQGAQLVFGTCPMVTLAMSESDAPQALVTADFGNGCEVSGLDGLMCSGSASGTLGSAPNTLALSFESFGCDDRTVTGSSTQTWSRGAGDIVFDGMWNLSIAQPDAPLVTLNGGGTLTFDASAGQSTITDFSGTFTRGAMSWNLSTSSLAVSYVDNANLIPSSGSLTIEGTQVGTIVVTFSSESPSTGIVQISVDDAPPVEFMLALLG